MEVIACISECFHLHLMVELIYIATAAIDVRGDDDAEVLTPACLTKVVSIWLNRTGLTLCLYPKLHTSCL